MDGFEAAGRRIEPPVGEGRGGQVPAGGAGVVVADHRDCGKQRHAVVGIGRICELVAPDGPLVRRPHGGGDRPAAAGRTHLEPGGVRRERVVARFVLEGDRGCEPLRAGGVRPVRVGDLAQERDGPAVPGLGALVGVVAVDDPVAQQIARLREQPAEDPAPVVRVGDGRRVAPVGGRASGPRGAVAAREPGRRRDLPVVAAGAGAVQDARERRLGARPVRGSAVERPHRHELLGTRQHEDVAAVLVERDAAGG